MGAPLHRLGLPIPTPAAIWVVITAVAVFVDATVAVVVDAFDAEQREFAFLARLHANHILRKLFVRLVSPIGIADAHLRDVSVAVQIVGRVFAGASVAVVVDRPLTRTRSMGHIRLMKMRVARIGAHHRHQIERPLVEQSANLRVPFVHLGEIPGGVQHDLDRLNLVGMDAAVDPHRRLLARVASARERHHPHISIAVRLAKALKLRELRMRLDNLLQQPGRLGVIVIAIPMCRHLRIAWGTEALIPVLALGLFGRRFG